MRKKLLSLKGPQIRLLLALCMCGIFLASTPTSPSQSKGCAEPHERGEMLVTNMSTCTVQVKLSGPVDWTFNLQPHPDGFSHLETRAGLYRYVALRLDNNNPAAGRVKTGSITVKKQGKSVLLIDIGN
jgi:hypothetical protein